MLAWLFARSEAGRLLIRMEDLTTQAAADHEDTQLADLASIGIDHDGDIWHQSERSDAHDRAITELEAAGLTYPCFCSRREIRQAAEAPHGPGNEGAYPGTCARLTEEQVESRLAEGRRPATRLRAGNRELSVADRVLGEIRGRVDDFVLRRADGVAAYNLAVVVDDADQGVDQVVRGDDLAFTTPRQLLLQALLGLAQPAYAHVPLVHGADGERLSKRHGAVTLAALAAEGIRPATVRGWIAESLGLASRGEEPSMSDLLDRFDPGRVRWSTWTFEPH